MSSQYTMCGIFALCAIAGCKPRSEKKLTDYKRGEITRCIELGSVKDDRFEQIRQKSIIRKCSLAMWAKLPIPIEDDKHIGIQIPSNGTKHYLPCGPDSHWIGYLEESIIAKCLDGEAWLYFDLPKHRGYYETTAIVHNGNTPTEYILSTDIGIDPYWSGHTPELVFVRSSPEWWEQEKKRLGLQD